MIGFSFWGEPFLQYRASTCSRYGAVIEPCAPVGAHAPQKSRLSGGFIRDRPGPHASSSRHVAGG